MKRAFLLFTMTCLFLVLLLCSCNNHSCEGGEWKTEKEATCSTEGLKAKRCIHCNKTLEKESIPTADHIYGLINYESHKEGDNCSDWVYSKSCKICGHKETMTNIKSHDFKRTDYKYSTCTELGYKTMTCSDCGETKIEYEKNLAIHIYENEYTSDGNAHWNLCKNCGRANDRIEHIEDETGNCTVCGTKVDYTEGVVYELSTGGSYAIVTGYTGSSDRVRILPEYEGVPVTHIADGAFQNAKSPYLYSISLTDNISYIGNNAFSECPYLRNVWHMENVTYIGSNAFYRNFALKLSALPERLEYIGDNAFNECEEITISSIPDSVTYVGSSAFYHCNRIQAIKLSSSLTEIKDNTFNYCFNLGAVEFCEGLVSIGNSAFKDCYYIESLVFPDSLVSIGENCFDHNNSLKSVYLGKGFEVIGDRAFNECFNLKEINTHAENQSLTSVDGAVYTKDLYTLICYPGGKSDGNLILPEGVKVILDYAFYGIGTIRKITLPSTLIDIGYGAFRDCKQLESVTILGPTNIGDYAFYGCVKLKNLNLSEGVVSIGEFAFMDGGFVELTIPDTVTSMGMWAFASCYYLEKVTVGSGLKHIPEGAFIYCGAYLDTVIISEGVETIGKNAFAFCYSLCNLSIPDSVTTIEENAFNECDKINTIILGSGISKIGKGAFQHCAQFTRIFYNGTPESWDSITIDSLNTEFEYVFKRYYYSESKPEGDGRYWYYSQLGKPTIWK